MRVDSSGRVLIATTSSSEASTNADDLVVGSSSTGTQHGITIATGGSSIGNIRFADAGDDTAGAVTYNHSTERLSFYANSGLRATIDSNGLKFGSDTAAANALDDYEEGSWTPQPYDGNNTFVTGQEYGKYTKIGNVVHCTYSINTNISGTSGYALFIQGLPFTVKDFSAGNVNEGISTQKGTGTEIDLEAQQGQTRFKFRSPSSGSALTPTNVGCVNGVTKSLIGSITYLT